jgi:hypothetical protein
MWILTELGKMLKHISKLQPESIGYYELKQHNPWFDEGCSKLTHQKKQAKLQWLQDPTKINGDNLKKI